MRFVFEKDVFIGHVNIGKVCLNVAVPEIGFVTILCINIIDHPRQIRVGWRVETISEGIPIIFSKVVKAGTTKVKISEKGPNPPKNFSIIHPYYKITTSAL